MREIRNDDWTNQVTVTANGATVAFSSPGKKVSLKITLLSDSNNVDPTIEAVGIMLK